MASRTDDLFRKATVSVAEGVFVLVAVSPDSGSEFLDALEFDPVQDQPFLIFRDSFELTLLLRDTLWDSVAETVPNARVQGGFRLVTLEIELAWDVVGFLSRVTAALAEAEISVGVMSSFSRDHLLINEDDLEAALAVLNDLMGEPTVGDVDGT
jgi:hypothetical protein